MNQTTEKPLVNDQPEFSRDFVLVLVTLTIATLLLVFGSERFRTRGFETSVPVLQETSLTLYPWVIAGGQTIANGLSEFSGKTPPAVSSGGRLRMLVSILLAFLLGPTLFFFGWRNKRIEEESGKGLPMLRVSVLSFALGGILTFLVAIPLIPQAIIQRLVSQSLHHAQDIQSNKDAIINELSLINLKAYEFYVIPTRLNGGGKSYAGFVLPASMTHTNDASYVVAPGDTSLTIKATSLKYPHSTVTCILDTEGRFRPGGWEYGGDFL